MPSYPTPATFRTAESFREHLRSAGASFDLDDAILPAPESPLVRPYRLRSGRVAGNRWCVLPMEGWDCLPNGAPSELTRRRWLRFATGGAKLLFGCEACAVMEGGRSNTRQMMLTEETFPEIASLLAECRRAHAERFGGAGDFLVGLQLTHSGRYSHPHDDARLEPVTAYSNPLLDRKFHCSEGDVVQDAAIPGIVEAFGRAAALAAKAGFDFVDVKCAHGYLAYEFLGARNRPGPYGGTFENRARFFRECVAAVRREAPGLGVAVRFSLFDMIPFERGEGGVGRPMEIPGVAGPGNYPQAFGGDGGGLAQDPGMRETSAFLSMCRDLGIELVCTTIASPYYAPHAQRPAYYPVSDGYLAPEDPVVGVDRQIRAVARAKAAFPDLAFVSAGLTALQDYLPHVAQRLVREGLTDFAGYGRMALSYPDLPADALRGGPLDRCRICRTFGDCTTAPRNGIVSGCYPLDRHYRESDGASRVRACKFHA
ncbi:MAG: NADH:flavin oxidoreductase [Kiritimatiellae bacterium]|nr:NADH:flavin oxidoreductase [Kiritimatiellia bacterium]